MPLFHHEGDEIVVVAKMAGVLYNDLCVHDRTSRAIPWAILLARERGGSPVSALWIQSFTGHPSVRE